MRYLFRHLPLAGSEDAVRASELAEYAAQTTGRFWELHETLMERGPAFAEGDFELISLEFSMPPRDEMHEPSFAAAQARVCGGNATSSLTCQSEFLNLPGALVSDVQ